MHPITRSSYLLHQLPVLAGPTPFDAGMSLNCDLSERLDHLALVSGELCPAQARVAVRIGVIPSEPMSSMSYQPPTLQLFRPLPLPTPSKSADRRPACQRSEPPKRYPVFQGWFQQVPLPSSAEDKTIRRWKKPTHRPTFILLCGLRKAMAIPAIKSMPRTPIRGRKLRLFIPWCAGTSRHEQLERGLTASAGACPQLGPDRSFAQVAPPGVPPFSSSYAAFARPR